MAPASTIEHFIHPGHRLTKLNHNTEFLCSGCKTSGNDTRYRCNACPNGFSMHEYCATCPAALSGSFTHPEHNLSLVVRKPQAAGRQNERLCDICGDGIEGLFYRCKICDFDVHPICTRLPEHVRHALHPEHPLKLEPGRPSWCAVCKEMCNSWRYRCGVCCVDIHVECILVPQSSSVPRSVPAPPGGMAPPPPPQYGGGAHGGYGYGYGFGGGQHGVPFGGYYDPHHMYPPGNQVHGGGGGGGGGDDRIKMGKMMSSLVGKLTVGVISNVVFGSMFSS